MCGGLEPHTEFCLMVSSWRWLTSSYWFSCHRTIRNLVHGHAGIVYFEITKKLWCTPDYSRYHSRYLEYSPIFGIRKVCTKGYSHNQRRQRQTKSKNSMYDPHKSLCSGCRDHYIVTHAASGAGTSSAGSIRHLLSHLLKLRRKKT